MFDLIGIKQDLEETFHRSVDVVRMRKNMNQFLKNRIEKEVGELLLVQTEDPR